MDYKEICMRNAIKAKQLAEECVEKGYNYGLAKNLTLMARSLDPGLKGISQLLDVVDVYIYYYEQQIGNEPDYYSILGADPSVDHDTLRRHYRKRSLSLHPDKNKCVGAAGAFSIVADALDFLSNQTKRFYYDIKWLNTRIEKKMKLGESSSSSPSDSSTNDNDNAAPNPTHRNSAPPTDQPPPPTDQPAAPPSHQPPAPTPHQPATAHPDDQPEQQAPPPPPNSSPLRAEDQGRDQTEPSRAPSPSSNKWSKVSTDERSGTDTMPASTPDDNQPKSSRFWTICYCCRAQFEYLRVYLRRKLRCPHCQKSFLAIEVSAPGTSRTRFPRKSNVQHSTFSSSQPTMSRNSNVPRANVAADGSTNKKRKETISPENMNVYRRRGKPRQSQAEKEK